jgi:hypothetical protein
MSCGPGGCGGATQFRLPQAQQAGGDNPLQQSQNGQQPQQAQQGNQAQQGQQEQKSPEYQKGFQDGQQTAAQQQQQQEGPPGALNALG